MTLDYFYGQAGELFSFYRIPKALFQEPRFQSLSTDAKTLYGILLDRMSLSAKNGWLDEQGRVFIIFTIEDRQKPHFEILRASRPGRYAAARLCLEEQSCLKPTGQHSEAQAHHPLHGSVYQINISFNFDLTPYIEGE